MDRRRRSDGGTRVFADAAGVLETFNFELARYNALIEDARRWVPQLQGASYAKSQGWDGSLEVFDGYGGITQVLEDLGVVRTDFAPAMADSGVIWGEAMSAETMPLHDADYIFDTFTVAYGETAVSPYERLNNVPPGWCSILTAVRRVATSFCRASIQQAQNSDLWNARFSMLRHMSGTDRV